MSSTIFFAMAGVVTRAALVKSGDGFFVTHITGDANQGGLNDAGQNDKNKSRITKVLKKR